MKEKILHDIFAKKPIKSLKENYIKYTPKKFSSFKIPEITVHGRFQPPLHINHFYTYVSTGFKIAEKVNILITNPDLNEKTVNQANHRNKEENNPFTFKERKKNI